MRRGIFLTCIALALAGCGSAQNKAQQSTESLATFDVQPPGIVAPPTMEAAPSSTGPLVAYTYQFGYVLEDAAIAPAQAKAVAACARLGPRRCLVKKSDLVRDADAGATGSVSLLVDARLATRFGAQLDGIANASGGTAAERHVSAEDLTKQIIDTAPRVRAKQALADRLVGVIRTGSGKVGELVEAERAFADVQEELDGARTNEAELRGRVAMSAVDVSYRSVRAIGAWAPVTRATDGLAESFAASIAALVTFVVVAIPWALLLAFVVWLLRWIGWRPRWPWRRRAAPPLA